jgi:Zn-dependent membrane protease YugP
MAVFMELEPWWLYVLCLSLQFTLAMSIDIAWSFARVRLDARHPDDLPLGTGQWVQQKLGELGAIDVQVVAAKGKDGVDAFFPSANVITLSEETYAKNDPSYWAVGAHELGHAMAYRGSRLFTVIERAARLLRDGLVGLAATMMFANMWYRLPDVTHVAYGLFETVLVCDVLVMLDEARASLFARRLLRGEIVLTPAMLKTCSLTLLAAFGTYFGAFIGRVILVVEWHVISEALAKKSAYVPAAPLSGTPLVIVGLLSAVLLAWGASWLVRLVRRAPAPSTFRTVAANAVRGVFVLAMLALVWNQPFGVVFVASCIAAIYSSRTTTSVLLLPVLVPFLIVLVPLFVVISLALVVSAGRARGGVGMADASSLVRSEAVTVLACWPMVILFWVYRLHA